MAVLLSYVNLTVPPGLWSWIEGELFLPKAWFEADQAAWRQRLGLAKELTCATQVELAWKLIQRARDPDRDVANISSLFSRFIILGLLNTDFQGWVVNRRMIGRSTPIVYGKTTQIIYLGPSIPPLL